MSETAELAAALAAAQAEIPPVAKSHKADVKNKDGKYLYSYFYADLADVNAAVLPVFGRHGLAFTAFPGHQADGKFGLKYYLLHSSGASIEGFFEIDDKGGMQLVGGRITYARRYTLSAVAGVSAEEDVDAREDGPSRTAQRARPRTPNSPPAAAATPSAAAPPTPRAQAAAGGDRPPLPGEEEAPGPEGTVRQNGKAGPGAPDQTDYDTRGTATRGKGGQLTALWTVLSAEFGFTSTDADKARARAVCEHIINRELDGGTTGNLSYNEARNVLDTLTHWQRQAEREGREPHDYMLALMMAQDGGPDE